MKKLYFYFKDSYSIKTFVIFTLLVLCTKVHSNESKKIYFKGASPTRAQNFYPSIKKLSRVKIGLSRWESTSYQLGDYVIPKDKSLQIDKIKNCQNIKQQDRSAKVPKALQSTFTIPFSNAISGAYRHPLGYELIYQKPITKKFTISNNSISRIFPARKLTSKEILRKATATEKEKYNNKVKRVKVTEYKNFTHSLLNELGYCKVKVVINNHWENHIESLVSVMIFRSLKLDKRYSNTQIDAEELFTLEGKEKYLAPDTGMVDQFSFGISPQGRKYYQSFSYLRGSTLEKPFRRIPVVFTYEFKKEVQSDEYHYSPKGEYWYPVRTKYPVTPAN